MSDQVNRPPEEGEVVWATPLPAFAEWWDGEVSVYNRPEIGLYVTSPRMKRCIYYGTEGAARAAWWTQQQRIDHLLGVARAAVRVALYGSHDTDDLISALAAAFPEWDGETIPEPLT